MGIFSSRDVTVVATAAQRCIKDKDIPDSTKVGLLKGILENGDIPEYMMEELSHSIGVRADRMFEYGAKEDGYMFGNPSSTVVAPVKGNAIVIDYLKQQAGQNIVMNYLRFGAMNWYHRAFIHLVSNYGYNAETNKVTFRPPGIQKPTYEVFLDSMIAHVHQKTIDTNVDVNDLDIWGNDPNTGTSPQRPYNGSYGLGDSLWTRAPTVKIIPDTEAEFIQVNLVWEHSYNDTTAQATIFEYPKYTFNLAKDWADGDYYQAMYTRQDGVAVFWTYLNGSGNPTLDAIFYTEPPKNEAGSFFPFIYFRYDKKDPTEDKKTDEYKQSKKMAKYIGLDFNTVTEAIHENPDVKDIEQAMMIMCVPANTENEMEQRYLFEFFDQMILQSDMPNDAFIGVGQMWKKDAKRSIIIEDKRFKLALGFNYMKKKLVPNAGKIGTCTSGTDFDKYNYQTSTEDGAIMTHINSQRYHWYRKQVTETLVEEIRVGNLRMTYHIWGKFTDTGNDEEEILLIPIDRSITNKYSIRIREELYARSLHFIFNTRQVIKLKWYQQEWFQIFMVVVAIVITAYSFGTGAQSLFTAIGAAASNAAVLIAIQTMALGFLKYLASLMVIKLFIKAVGGEAAMILALFALAYGVYNGANLFGAAAKGVASWATTLVDLATSLIKGVGNFYQDELSKISDEISALGKDFEREMALIDDARELLDQQTILSPLTIFGESPDQYYARTIHSGNIGCVALDFPRTYVDQALALPEFSNSINVPER